MRTLVVGGGGPIGQAVVRACAARGDQVRWTSRQALTPPGAAQGHVQADRARPEGIAGIVHDQRIETIIDMVAYQAADTLPLLRALDGRLGRYVLVSSCDVYRNYGLLQRLETGAPDQGPLDETAPLRASRFPYRGALPRPADAADRWMDDYDKIPIEGAVCEMGCDWTILRLPMVYGPGDRQRRFRWAIRPMLSGAPVLAAPSTWLDWVTGYGFTDNVAAAIAHAAGHPKAINRVFNVGDEPAMDHRDWIERFRAATGWLGAVETTDADTPFGRAVSGMDLLVRLDTASDRLFAELDFCPPVGPLEAARRTVADEAAR